MKNEGDGGVETGGGDGSEKGSLMEEGKKLGEIVSASAPPQTSGTQRRTTWTQSRHNVTAFRTQGN